MIIGCPECSTRYELPEDLMGPRGARVRCPECRARFDVARAPVAALEPAIAPAVLAAESPTVPGAVGAGPGHSSRADTRALAAADAPGQDRAPRQAEATIAREIVEGLADRAPEIFEAEARGRLFAEAGPQLLDAFDEYRRRVGPGADAGAFRDALRERWGIHLAARRG